jgi:hypothetical protein
MVSINIDASVITTRDEMDRDYHRLPTMSANVPTPLHVRSDSSTKSKIGFPKNKVDLSLFDIEMLTVNESLCNYFDNKNI